MTRAAPAAAVLLLALTVSARAGLRADELLLLTNQNDPASAKLAGEYAAARHVPTGRVLALDVPLGEEITPDGYDRAIAAPVRAFLASPAGANVRCLVLFYGLPLRVAARTATAADTAEVATLRTLAAALDHAADGITGEFDAIAKGAGVTVPAQPIGGVIEDRAHVRVIEQALQAAVQHDPDAGRRTALARRVQAEQQGSIDAAGRALAGVWPTTAPSGPVTPDAAKAAFARPRDAAARDAVRRFVASTGGVFALFDVAASQAMWADNAESDASVDSELALVRFEDVPHAHWQPNPLSYKAAATHSAAIMTARIDAPTPQIASRMIRDAVAVEADGLDGRVVFDSRGLPAITNGKPDPYGWYDQTLRDTAAMLKAKTKLDVVTDDRVAVLPPHSVNAVAAYCGWYSLRQYVPGCGFVRGAVAYHVASFELVSLHDRFEKGWVANLLRDGVCATLGPVGEPYLASFPRPDEFFPLLMTGRLTLAEVYWATCPMTSWKQTLIGDPLYRPYARRPALGLDDLSPALRTAVQKIDATQPSDR